MIENKNEVSKDLEKALQALEQAKHRAANEKKKPILRQSDMTGRTLRGNFRTRADSTTDIKLSVRQLAK